MSSSLFESVAQYLREQVTSHQSDYCEIQRTARNPITGLRAVLILRLVQGRRISACRST